MQLLRSEAPRSVRRRSVLRRRVHIRTAAITPTRLATEATRNANDAGSIGLGVQQRSTLSSIWHSFEGRLPLGSGKPACKQTREAQINRRTRTLQHRTLCAKRGRGGRRGHLLACGRDPKSRWASASCAAKSCRSLRVGCRSDGNEPKLQGRCGARACGSSLAGRRGLAELQQDADFRALLRPQPDQHEERRASSRSYVPTTPGD